MPKAKRVKEFTHETTDKSPINKFSHSSLQADRIYILNQKLKKETQQVKKVPIDTQVPKKGPL